MQLPLSLFLSGPQRKVRGEKRPFAVHLQSPTKPSTVGRLAGQEEQAICNQPELASSSASSINRLCSWFDYGFNSKHSLGLNVFTSKIGSNCCLVSWAGTHTQDGLNDD
jgi:hypothetical protein